MATRIFQNQTQFDIGVPTENSSLVLHSGEYVGGTYYLHVPNLVEVTDQNIDPELVLYFYPDSADLGFSTDGFDTALGTLPIKVEVTGTSFTVSLDPISGSNILDGQMIRSLNGLTDIVSITGQAGISVDVNVGMNSLDITNTQLGLTDVYPTAPLYLELGEGNVSLSGWIEITPVDNGGAVALQTGIPVYQNDFAALRALYLESALDVDPFLRVYDASSALLTSLDKDGTFYTPGVLAESVGSTLAVVYSSVAYDGTDYTTLVPRVVLDGTEVEPNYFDLSFDLRDVITLDKSIVSPGEIGRIEGEQEASYINPFITLTTIPDQTTPLIELVGGYTDGTANTNVFLEVVDNLGASLISLHGDGIVTAKSIEADTVTATTVYADNIFTNTLYVTGPDTVNVTTSGGPGTIIANCSGGIIEGSQTQTSVIVQLPDLAAFDKSLQITILKVDTTHNAISIVNGANSTINGETEALSIINQYAGVTLTSSGIHWYITGTVG